MAEEVVLINPKDYEIDESMTTNITSKIVTLKKERDILAQRYLEVMQMDIDNPETAKEARKIRLLIRDNRTKGFEPQRVADKKVPLRLGQFIDAVYGAETTENVRMENGLESIEKHAENLEKQRLEALQAERKLEIAPYVAEDFSYPDLSNMDQEVFDAYLSTKKASFEAKIAAEKKAEEERLERERIQDLHNERFKLLLPLWQFVEDKEANFGVLSQENFEALLLSKTNASLAFEKDQEATRLENLRLKEEADKREAGAKKQHEAQEAALAEERRKAQELADKQQKEKETLEAQLKKEREEKAAEEAKKQAEIEEEKLRKENLAKAGDKAILLDWVTKSFPTPTRPDGLTEAGNAKVLELVQKFDGFRKWALTQIEA